MIGFHTVVLRQSVLCRDPVNQGKETSCQGRKVLCRDKVSNGGEVLSRDKVWPNGEVLCCGRAILCRDIVGQTKKFFLSRQSNSMS